MIPYYWWCQFIYLHLLMSLKRRGRIALSHTLCYPLKAQSYYWWPRLMEVRLSSQPCCLSMSRILSFLHRQRWLINYRQSDSFPKKISYINTMFTLTLAPKSNGKIYPLSSRKLSRSSLITPASDATMPESSSKDIILFILFILMTI